MSAMLAYGLTLRSLNNLRELSLRDLEYSYLFYIAPLLELSSLKTVTLSEYVCQKDNESFSKSFYS